MVMVELNCRTFKCNNNYHRIGRRSNLSNSLFRSLSTAIITFISIYYYEMPRWYQNYYWSNIIVIRFSLYVSFLVGQHYIRTRRKYDSIKYECWNQGLQKRGSKKLRRNRKKWGRAIMNTAKHESCITRTSLKKNCRNASTLACVWVTDRGTLCKSSPCHLFTHELVVYHIVNLWVSHWSGGFHSSHHILGARRAVSVVRR